jgi:formylglycine-generating enzyme required for sulfatase activity
MDKLITSTRLILAATVTFAIAVAPVALAATDDGPHATAGAVSAAKFKKLKQQVAALQQELDALQLQPGSQGPQGEQGQPGAQGQPGVAPACHGNDANDVMVPAGSVCIDRYEVSVWSSPTGGTQYGTDFADYPCNANGQDCDNIYARSVPGAQPSRFITYFQAQQALANVGKRLPTNAEWQQAVAGTPDPGATPGAEDCNTSSAGPVATGSRDNCVSHFGATDMIGNVWELVADWDEAADGCANWPAGFGSDDACFSDGTPSRFPGALHRGGDFADGSDAGSFAVSALIQPSDASFHLGFRGAR